MSRHAATLWIAAASLLSHAARAEDGTAVPNTDAPGPPPYIRAVEDPETGAVRLEYARRRLDPAAGQGTRVWLVGASHMGLKEYYADTQAFLDPIPLVLFEDIGATDPEAGDPDVAPSAYQVRRRRGLATFPKFARMHGLVSQAESIDYRRPNFEYCDITPRQMEALLTQSMGRPPGTGPKPTTAAPPPAERPDAATQAVLDGLARNPGARMVMGRLFMIESSKNGVLPTDAPGMEGFHAVTIDKRNAFLVEQIGKRLDGERPVTELAVYYGAGHLPFVERRLAEERGYRVGEETWLTAVTAGPDDLGLSADDFRLLRKFVGAQLAAQSTAPRPGRASHDVSP